MTKYIIKIDDKYLLKISSYNKDGLIVYLADTIGEAFKFDYEKANEKITMLKTLKYNASIIEYAPAASTSVKEAQRLKISLEQTIKDLITTFERETFTTVECIDINEISIEFGRKRTFSIKIDVNL